MRFTFLGTSSGTPTRERNVSGAALRFDDGRVWIFDCGEATQHRLLETDLRPGRIEAIFITHLHGDHCYGLPGLLASITVHGRQQDPVHLIGPKGLKSWLNLTRKVSRMGLAFPVEVHELPDDGMDFNLGGCRIQVLAMRHRLTCYGFRLDEAPRRGRFDAAKADRLGIDGPQRAALVKGEAVQLADGSTIGPADVIGSDRPGRRLAILGDTASSDHLVDELQDCDLVVHECTYDASRQAKAEEWGHATTAVVADFAKATRPRLLALNHFSSRYFSEGAEVTIADLVQEVEAGAPGQRVVAGDDGMHLEIPYPDENRSGVS